MMARQQLRDELFATVMMTLLLLGASSLAPQPAMAATLPEMRSQGTVQYVSGGVGKDESDAMKQASAEYPLLLEFSSTSKGIQDGNGKGEFLADVDVAIRDANGKEILHAQSDGPLMLVRVPPGQYSVTAEWHGVRKQGSADISAGGHKRVVMAW